MFLHELFAKDVDLTENGKLILVQLFLGGDEGGSIKSIFTSVTNDENIAKERELLLDLGAIALTDTESFYRVTNVGKDMLRRASLLDDNDELIDSNTSKYLPAPPE